MQSDKVLKVHFITNGCDEGRLNTHRLKLLSKDAGFSYTDDLMQADLVLFYACGHLKARDTQALQIIETMQKAKKPSAQLIVWGCLPKINPWILRKVYDGPLVGPDDWSFFSDLFNQPRERIHQIFANTLHPRTESNRPQDKIVGFINQSLSTHVGKTWYIKIVSGCRNCCTFCTDRLAYNWSRSVPLDTILKQFELGLAANYKHFYFVGRDLGSYGYDIGLTLADLLNKIAETYPNQAYKISLVNVSPNFLIAIYPKLNQTVLSKRIFEIGSHIQSGSERILKLMDKTFKLDDWIRTMKDIDRNYPNIRLATSVMTGFPGETEDDFKKTMNLLSNLPFDRVVTYAYNERPNLPSLKLKDRVPEATKIKRKRKAETLAKVNTIRKRIKRTRILY